MADAIRWKSKIVLAKIEATYGVDPAPTGEANAILITDAEITPMEGEDVERNLEQPYLGGQEEIPTGLRSVLTGSTELAGSGEAGTVPAWAVLARACGMAEVVTAATSVAYNPVSDAHESCTIHFWIGSTQHVLKGVRGTGVLTVNAQGIPVIRWTLTGLFTTPAEGVPPTPDFSAFQEPLVATNQNTPVFTVNSVSLVLRNYSVDLGNDVQPRLLIGREEIKIVNRAEKITASVEAVELGTFNPFALAETNTRMPVVLTHGTVAGNIASFSAPTCQVMRMPGYENQQDVLEWPLALNPLPDAGNDQFTLTLT